MQFIMEEVRLKEVLKNVLRPVVSTLSRARSKVERFLGVPPKKQIVICGYPRSGTSLLYNMMASSISGFKFENFEVSALRRIHRYGDYLTKSPTDIMLVSELPELNVHNKQIYVVALLRDIRDIITSVHPNIPDRYFISYESSLWPQIGNINEWTYNAPGVGAIYEKLQSAENISEIKLIKVYYEDLVAKPDTVQDYLKKELGVTFHKPFSEFYKEKDKLPYRYEGTSKSKSLDPSLVREDKPVDPSRAGKWRNPKHKDRIKMQFNEYPQLFEILTVNGYEKDDSWYSEYKE